MKEFGIDVSTWQAGFNFVKAKAEGVKFAILRGAYSAPGIAYNAGKDTQFENHFAAAVRAGLNIGVYQYSMAQSVSQAWQEAEFLYNNVLKGRRFELPIYIDVEDNVQMKLGKKLLTELVKAWCSYLEGKGYYVGIYASKSFLGEYLYDGELTGYTHWVAQWTTSCTYMPASILGMWQFGGKSNAIRSNKVAGVTCDQNYMLTDFPTIIQNRGLNGYPKPTPQEKEVKITMAELSGINIPRYEDTLVLITDGRSTTGFNQFGTDCIVDGQGKIITCKYGMANRPIPKGCICLSGHGKMSRFLLENCKEGTKLQIG